jgi:hypothetical protein
MGPLLADRQSLVPVRPEQPLAGYYCWSWTDPVIVAVLPTLTGVTVSVVPSTQYEYSCAPAVIVSVLPATV